MTAIDAYLRNETFSMPFINSLFALDDFENPVQPYIDDSLFFELDTTKIKKANLFIQ